MKGRNGWAIAASALLCVTGGRVSAQNALLVSGQASLAVIDTNGDGPDSTDCQFGALLSNLMSGPPMTADMLIAGSQSNTPLLRACQLSFDAAGTKGSDTSSNFASAYIYNAHGPMGFNFPNSLPLIAELVDETPNPNTNNPVMMNDLADAGSVQDERVSQPVLGGLCRAGGGAVARIQMSGAPGLLVDLSLYPNSMNPSYLKVPGPPLVFEKAAGGFQSFDAYIPVTADQHITVAAASAPSTLLVDINLGALPVCGRVAPTLSGFCMIVAAMGLLALGAFSLSRRDNFARALAF